VNNLIRPLHAALEKVRHHSISRAEAAQREVDKVLRESINNVRPSWAISFAYARSVIVGSLFRPAVHVAAAAILAIVMSTHIFIPLGTMDISIRLSLITVAMLVGTSLSYFLLYLMLSLHVRYRFSLWAIAAAHTLSSAVLFCLIEPQIIHYIGVYSVPEFRSIFIPILLLYGLADMFVLWQFKKEICILDYAQKHNPSHLKSLLPADKRGEVWLISAADHYVEIFTDHGRHLRRMTMKAAVERAGAKDGLQVHRSHWVAFEAMLSMKKDGERFFLSLRSGQQVPVSRKQVKQVRNYLDEMSTLT